MNLTHRIFLMVVMILLPLLAACSSNTASAAAITRIGQKINCVCGGCDLTVITCDDNAGQACETARKQVVLIKKGLSRGQMDEQIIKDMVGIYGQRALIQ